jgi:hypothetical protein
VGAGHATKLLHHQADRTGRKKQAEEEGRKLEAVARPSQNEGKRIEANRAAKQKLWHEIAARA